MSSERWAGDEHKTIYGIDSGEQVEGQQRVRVMVTKAHLLEQLQFADHTRGCLDYETLRIEVEHHEGVTSSRLVFKHEGGTHPAEFCPNCKQGFMQTFGLETPIVVEKGDAVTLVARVTPYPTRLIATAIGRPEVAGVPPELAAKVAT